MSDSDATQGQTEPTPNWKPIPALERRILGVLGEKAKTTPDAYPLSLNALVNGCNQKSNRYPQMNVEPIQAENALERLRAIGAVSEVHGGGRVAKYKHYIYEWLGVSKVESAVMIELLLRGAQTLGELRGRAARMEPISEVSELKPIVAGLIGRGLAVSLTPEGRGQIVTHALYLDEEMEKVKRKASELASASADRPAPSVSPAASPNAAVRSGSAATPAAPGALEELRDEVAQLRSEVAKLRTDIEDIWKNLA